MAGQEPREEDTQNDLKFPGENTSIEEFSNSSMGVRVGVLGKGGGFKDIDFITKFLKFLLGIWA